MAESIVGGLFGINPAMYQQQQQQQVLNNAIAMQKLSPFEQAGVGLQQAGYNFAGALGGAMGGVDPQLQRISALNAISKQIDQSNPESMMQGAKMLADAGFTQEAFGLAEYARKANSELALAQQRMRADKVAAPETTNEIKNANAIADLSAFPRGTPGHTRIVQEELARLTTKPDKENPTTNEIKNATAIADASGFAKGTPEYNNAYKEALTALTAKPLPATKDKKVSEFGQLLQEAGMDPESQEYKDQVKAFAKLKLEKPDKTTEAVKPNIKEIGVSAKGDAVYLDVNNDEQFTYKIVDGKTVRQPYAGTVDRTTAKVSATANAPATKQEEEFSKQRGKDQAAALAEASTAARAASQAITSITTMKQLDQTGQLVTGPLANSYVGASNLLASIGLLSKNQVSILTSSQVYDKSAKDLVMQDLGGKLGAQISDADRKFVEDRIPQLTTSAKARTELLNKIEQIQRGKIAYYGKMKAHANKNRNLDDFDFSEVYTVTPPVGSPAASSVKSKADAIIKGTQ